MKVTKDQYELPIAVADSVKELAYLTKVKEESIRTYLSKKKDGWKKVEIN